MAAIDAEYWDKCVSKVMKEVHQYMIYDGLVTEEVIEDNLMPESPLPDSIPEGDADDAMPHTSSIVPAKNTKKNNDVLKNLVVKQCTEELISPTKLAAMHKRSENTIRKWVKSSGVPFPLKYQQTSQQKIAFSFASYKQDRSLLTANDATRSLSEELILNLKSKWPSLSISDETPSVSHPNSSNDLNHEPMLPAPGLQNEEKSIEKSVQCPKCSFKASTRRHLVQHLNGHNDCQLCDKVFLGSNGKARLASHMKTHQVKPKKLCIFCNRDYKNTQNMNRHMKICKKKPNDWIGLDLD